MRQRQLFVCSHSPSDGLALEAYDAVLMAAMLEQEVSLLFIGDGIEQLTAADRAVTAKLQNLSGFGVEAAFMSRTDANKRRFDHSRCLLPVQLLDHNELNALFAQQDRIYSF